MKLRQNLLNATVLLAELACSAGSPPSNVPNTTRTAVQEPSTPPVNSRGEDYRPGLSRAATRQRTIQQVIARFDTLAKNGTQKPEAQSFIARYAEPLSTAFVEGYDDLAPTTRINLVNLLVSFQHPDGVPAAVHALESYAKSAQQTEEAIWACRLLQKVPSSSAASALMNVFNSIDMSNKNGRRVSAHLERAMLKNAHSSWINGLAQVLEQNQERPASFNDKTAVRVFRNRRYRQRVSVKLLGELRAGDKSRTVLRAWLTRSKRELHDDAQLALLKLGRPAISAAENLLAGADEELVQLAQERYREQPKAHVLAGAQLLGYLGAPESYAALAKAWETHHEAHLRVLLIYAMSALPKTDGTIDRWQRTFSNTSVKTTLPMGASGLEALAEAGLRMFEPSLVEWVTPRVETLRGGGARKGDAQRALILMISHLVLPQQANTANRVALKYGGRVATPAFERGVQLANRCKGDANCYLGAVRTSGTLTESDALQSIKSIAMVARFGGPPHKMHLVSLVSKVPQLQVLKVLLRAIEYLSPQGDKVSSKQLADYAVTLDKPGSTTEQHTIGSLIQQTALRLAR